MTTTAPCIPLKNGRNNQVFRLNLAPDLTNWEAFSAFLSHLGHPLSPPDQSFPFPIGYETVVLKKYFQHPADPRLRLQSEFAFLSFATSQQLDCIPEPLAAHFGENWGIYSFLPGNQPQFVDKRGIDAALSFLIRLNVHKQQGIHLPPASEACFSTWNFYEAVEKRLLKLQQSDSSLLKDFVEKELLPKWEKINKKIPPQALDQEELILTPSDFGFHNALVHNGDYFFLDFEYAGWDDPAKTIVDFFCQPQIPVSMDYFSKVSQKIAELGAHPEECLKRIEALFPICQIKWCCIMLGGLIGAGKARRDFSQYNENEQIEKTRKYLSAI